MHEKTVCPGKTDMLLNYTQNWLPQASENCAVIGQKCGVGVANLLKPICCLFFLSKGDLVLWDCPKRALGLLPEPGEVFCAGPTRRRRQTPEPSHLEDFFRSPWLLPIREGWNILHRDARSASLLTQHFAAVLIFLSF